jgi:hypothetical protein
MQKEARKGKSLKLQSIFDKQGIAVARTREGLELAKTGVIVSE